jgi:hydroxypyruvate reductase
MPFPAARPRDLKAQRCRAVILSGGELIVTLRGKGRGGPNQECAIGLAGPEGTAGLAGDTDRTDGGTGPPGRPRQEHLSMTTLSRACRLGLAPAQYLDDNNSTEFFEKLGDLRVPGPTLANVNDFRAIVVDSS